MTATETDPFVYLAAHDLRAPLMSVKGILSVMRLDAERKNLDHYFNLLETSIDKMNQSISDIISHSTEKNSDAQVMPVDLKKIADECVQSLRYLAGAEQVSIEVIADGISDFNSDPQRLFSIFSNMISNAIRYRSGARPSRLKVSMHGNPDGVQIIFEDNGIGIEKNLQEKVFHKFFRVSQTHGGSGLGLYIVQSSVEKMGGSIHVHSTPGEGTSFVIYLPHRRSGDALSTQSN